MIPVNEHLPGLDDIDGQHDQLVDHEVNVVKLL
jgi:hypothetical protein